MSNLLATKQGLTDLYSVLIYCGDMCPKCGYGTRKTSKNWARCKQCNERIPRRPLPESTK